MPIVVHCPKCGTRYQFKEALAGRQAKCRCGRRITLPPPEAKPAASQERDRGQHQHGQRDPSSQSDDESLPSTASAPAKAVADEPSGAMAWIRALPMPTVIGYLSVGYGSVAALVIFGRLAVEGHIGGFLNLFGLADLALAVILVAAGVLTLKGHEQGPMFAGVTCMIFCFFPFIDAVMSSITTPPALEPGMFLWRWLKLAIIFPIPIFIAVWAFREEARKEREAEEDD